MNSSLSISCTVTKAKRFKFDQRSSNEILRNSVTLASSRYVIYRRRSRDSSLSVIYSRVSGHIYHTARGRDNNARWTNGRPTKQSFLWRQTKNERHGSTRHVSPRGGRGRKQNITSVAFRYIRFATAIPFPNQYRINIYPYVMCAHSVA